MKNIKSIKRINVDTYEQDIDMSGECVGGVCPIR